MVGEIRGGLLGVEAPDPVLSLVSSLGLALVAGTAVVVDVEGGVATDRSLGDLATDGPSLLDLSPGRAGVALISGRGADAVQRQALIELLARHWPAVVVRVRPGQWQGPVVPVRALIPGILAPSALGVAVWQPVSRQMRAPGDGPLMPILGARTTRALLAGRSIHRDRWVRSWAPVWSMPWA